MKKITILFFLCLQFVVSANSAHAQYWSVWERTHSITIGLSSDEKWAFFMQKNEAGIANIYKIELKTNAVTPVTNFTERPVQSAIALFGKQPAVVYSRAASTKGDDTHLYRINVLATDPPVDFTPKDGSSSKKILGLAYNGRYVYYLSDKGAGSKTDIYRYDAAQYIIELAFANDKEYVPLCWSRDQTHMLLRDPKTLDVYNYSIENTNKVKIDLPFTGSDLKTVFYDPMNTGYYMINEHDKLSTCKLGATEKSEAEKIAELKEVHTANLSLYGKYIHVDDGKSEKVFDTSSHSFIDLPADGYDLVIGPKEASVLFANTEGGIRKLYLYDIAKKTTKELTVIK